jgi:hypothetical protein
VAVKAWNHIQGWYILLWRVAIENRPNIAEVEVNLQQTVSRPVCLGVRRPSGTRDQFFFLLEIPSDNCWFVILWRPLWREDGSVIYCKLLLDLARAVTLRSKSCRTHGHWWRTVSKDRLICWTAMYSDMLECTWSKERWDMMNSDKKFWYVEEWRNESEEGPTRLKTRLNISKGLNLVLVHPVALV